MTEDEEKANLDLILYGTCYMKDGKHIPIEQVILLRSTDQMIDVKEVTKQAQKELDEEAFREAVEKAKVKIRNQKSLMRRLFPYKIVFIKK